MPKKAKGKDKPSGIKVTHEPRPKPKGKAGTKLRMTEASINRLIKSRKGKRGN